MALMHIGYFYLHLTNSKECILLCEERSQLQGIRVNLVI